MLTLQHGSDNMTREKSDQTWKVQYVFGRFNLSESNFKDTILMRDSGLN